MFSFSCGAPCTRHGVYSTLIGIIFVACAIMQMPLAIANVAQQQNNMNNMLRDTTYNKNAANVQVLSDNDIGSALTNLDSNNYVSDDFPSEFSAASEHSASDEYSSVELLRFVDERDEAMLKQLTTSTAATTKPTQINTATGTLNTNPTTTTTTPAYNANGSDNPLSLDEQVQLLSKQLNALMLRRREDYELLEHNLRKSLRIGNEGGTTLVTANNPDVRAELQELRREVAALRDSHLNGNKERLTVEWLKQSIAELRKQLVELQDLASDASKSVNHRTQSYEDLATIRNDFAQLKLELVALRERQQQNEVFIQELREEAVQQEEDYKRLLLRITNSPTTVVKGMQTNSMPMVVSVAVSKKVDKQQKEHSIEIDAQNNELLNTDPLAADHKRRHYRFQRQQIHELQLAQRSLKTQLNEFKYHRIDERVRNLEIEQHRIADANFNLSRQIASLDKLHTSMLELLEDVESLQTKMDKNIPELRHEISKLEFSSAQLTAEQSLLREEGKNVARSVQAMAVSVSTLQDERDVNKQMQLLVAQLRGKLDRLESVMQDMQRAVMQQQQQQQQQHSSVHKRHHTHQQHVNHNHQQQQQQHEIDNKNSFKNNMGNDAIVEPTHIAESLVAKLENVEEQYESIIQNLPQDCSEIANNNNNADGIFMISPPDQQRPRMVHCTADGWTMVQRRFDGSADFNRSWADYADGFGQPSGEYWIGNEQLHHLTRNNCTQLRVIMQDIYDNIWLAQYEHFYISSKADGYRLNTAGYNGNASDALDYQQGMQFSAIDVDRDISQTHCAANYEGGWWFSHCQHANLNGRYNLGLTWFDAARNEWIAVKSSQMFIKRQTIEKCNSIALDAKVMTFSMSTTTTSLPVIVHPSSIGHQLLSTNDTLHTGAMRVAAAQSVPASMLGRTTTTKWSVRSPATIAAYASVANL